MLTIETERRVSKWIACLLEYETLTLKCKNELVSNEMFNPYQCFKALDKNNKRKIDSYDIVSFLKKNRIHCTLHEASFIILFYDPEQSGYFTYGNFLNFLLSNFNTYSNIENFMTSQTEGTLVDLLDNSIEVLLVNIFKAEIDLIRNSDALVNEIKKRYDFNVQDMFNSIAEGNNIGIDNMKRFLIRNGLYYKEEEIALIIKRLSIDKNGLVSLLEFKRMFEVGYCIAISKHIKEGMLKCPSGDISIGYEKNKQNKFITFDSQNKTHSNYENSNLNLRTVNINTIGTIGDVDNCYTNINQSISFTNSTKDNNTSDIYEEKVFINFFKILLESEREIEKAKSELALRSDFNIEDAFRIFESNDLGYITENDLIYGFNALSLNIPAQNIKLFMSKYDLINEGVLSFNNFFDMIVPFTKQYRDMIEARCEMTYTPKYNKIDVFLSSTLLYFQQLLRLINYTEESIEKQRNLLSSMSKIYMSNIFKKIDLDNKGYLTPFDLGKYLKKNNVIIIESEADLLFIRLDRNRDGKVVITDFYHEMDPVIVSKKSN